MPKIDKTTVVPAGRTDVMIPETAKGLTPSYTTGLPDVAPDRVNTLYFASKMSKHYDAMKAAVAGLSDGSPVLYTSDDDGYYAVERVMLLQADLFYTDMDDGGNIVAASRSDGPGLQEDYQAILLAVLADELVPCRTSFRKTRSPAGRDLIRAAKKAGNSPVAFASFVGKLRVTMKSPRAGGRPYPLVNADIQPSTEHDRKLVETAFADPAFTTALAQVQEAYRKRLNYLEGFVGK